MTANQRLPSLSHANGYLDDQVAPDSVAKSHGLPGFDLCTDEERRVLILRRKTRVWAEVWKELKWPQARGFTFLADHKAQNPGFAESLRYIEQDTNPSVDAMLEISMWLLAGGEALDVLREMLKSGQPKDRIAAANSILKVTGYLSGGANRLRPAPKPQGPRRVQWERIEPDGAREQGYLEEG